MTAQLVTMPDTEYEGPWKCEPYVDRFGDFDTSPEALLIYRHAVDNPGLYIHQVAIGPWLAGDGTFRRHLDALRILGEQNAHVRLRSACDILQVLRDAEQLQIIEARTGLDKLRDAGNAIGQVLLAHEIIEQLAAKVDVSACFLPTTLVCDRADPIVIDTLAYRCDATAVVEYGPLSPLHLAGDSRSARRRSGFRRRACAG